MGYAEEYRVSGELLNGTKAFYEVGKYKRNSVTRLKCKITKTITDRMTRII